DDARKLRFWFFLLLSADPPYLHSFPTRRSSDLIVEQFGLATIPLGIRASASAFTSGTTSGTSGSMRQALELSTTIAPARAAIGLYSRLTLAGVLERTISMPAKASGRIASMPYFLP